MHDFDWPSLFFGVASRYNSHNITRNSRCEFILIGQAFYVPPAALLSGRTKEGQLLGLPVYGLHRPPGQRQAWQRRTRAPAQPVAHAAPERLGDRRMGHLRRQSGRRHGQGLRTGKTPLCFLTSPPSPARNVRFFAFSLLRFFFLLTQETRDDI